MRDIVNPVRLLALLGLLSGCASSKQSLVTWEEAVAAPRPTQKLEAKTPPPVFDDGSVEEISPEVILAVRFDDDGFGGSPAIVGPAGPHIDRALARFRGRRAVAPGLPRGHAARVQAWNEVLGALEDACTIVPRATDLGAFVRARVTLEVEIEADRARGVAPDGKVEQRLASALSELDARVDELRLVVPLGLDGANPQSDVITVASPITSPLISSHFGLRRDPFTQARRFHAGMDFAAPTGTMIYAAAPGVVVFAGKHGGHGRYVVIDHGQGIRSHYSHLERIFVSGGEVIREGDTLGAVGSTGRSTGPHLHFAISNRGGNYIDPAPLIGRSFVVDAMGDMHFVERPRPALSSRDRPRTDRVARQDAGSQTRALSSR